jgi:hypothetical protein
LATATTNDIDEIRRKMAQIRRELHEDVREVVAGAGEVTDWRRYVRAYPWAAVGVTAGVGCLVGYLFVHKPKRGVPRDVARKADVAEVREAVAQALDAGSDEPKRRKSLVGAAFAMLTPLAWRAAQNYAMGYLEQWIAQQQQQYFATSGPPPGGIPPHGTPGPGTGPAPGPGQRPGPGPGRPGGPPRPGGPLGY